MRLFYTVIGVMIAAMLASIGSWIAFGPGPRAFSGTGLFLLSPDASDMVGRIVFGFGAMLTWLSRSHSRSAARASSCPASRADQAARRESPCPTMPRGSGT